MTDDWWPLFIKNLRSFLSDACMTFGRCKVRVHQTSSIFNIRYSAVRYSKFPCRLMQGMQAPRNEGLPRRQGGDGGPGFIFPTQGCYPFPSFRAANPSCYTSYIFPLWHLRVDDAWSPSHQQSTINNLRSSNLSVWIINFLLPSNLYLPYPQLPPPVRPQPVWRVFPDDGFQFIGITPGDFPIRKFVYIICQNW